ncbi:MAG TPA: hypothetical protein DEQ20_10770 [Desulfobulbaceae bacterium]|nr:MAG: hypothetical protein A2520_04480 [Deltaproteobacteria bacterium RIFOXYD12_FULL_53_23]HCC55385.1 hypothetical protein [Desulfobulbaceae bacterium]
MTPQAALIELLGRLGANQGVAVLVNDDELRQWPSAAVKAMKSQKLIAKARPAPSALCPGCESECVMPVHTQPASTGAPVSFIVCDKRSDINRVPVPIERLTQWQCSVDAVCGFVAASLGLRRSDKQTTRADLWEIGIATGDKRSQMLCLQGNGVLILVAGNSKIPLAELIEYQDGGYSLDGAMIRQMVDAATTADNRYTPSEVKREARKLDTQARHASWQKKYRELKREKPGKTNSWYANKIAKSDIAIGCVVGTILRNMKK